MTTEAASSPWSDALLAATLFALLVPYLVWVTYAAALNAAVVRLNGPFPGA